MAEFEDFEKKEGYTEGSTDNGSQNYSSEQSGNERPYRSNYEGGYRSYGNRQGGYNNGYRQGSYHRGGYSNNRGGYNRYRSNGYNDYQRSENDQFVGEAGNNAFSERSSRPRFSLNNNGYRPRYNNGYQRQGDGDNQGEGGYRPRFNNGGYANRQGGYGNQGDGSYRPRFNNGGYSNRQGGYRQGGFQRGGFNNRYNPKRRTAFAESVSDPDAPIRLNKFLANAGVCSRRDADKYIEAGVVKVNGEVVTEMGAKVLRTDEVHFHDQLIKPELKIYVLLNKPKGYVTTSEDPNNRKTVMDLVRGACPERIYPVGRLDRNTTGVLLLTNDGEMASKLTHPKYLKKKIYHVWLDKNLKQEDAQRIADGITLDDGEIKADDIQYVNTADRKQVGIEIHSGRNRIVRRMFEALGYHVIKLDRVFFAGLTKKNLKRGAWRFLTENEVNFLRMGSFE